MANYPNYQRGAAGQVAGGHSAGRRVNGLAIASLALGVATLIFSCLTGLVGLVLGIIAIVQIQGSQGRYSGSGMAIAGIVLSLMFSMVMPVALLLPAYMSTRNAVEEARDRVMTQNNMREIGIAFHNYESRNAAFPTDHWVDGKPGLSWRVMILPHLQGGEELFKQFRLDEPWDSLHNLKMAEHMPEQFRMAGVKLAEDETVFKRPVGQGAIFEGTEGEKSGFSSIRDGSSNTLLLVAVTASESTIWTKPDDYAFDPSQPKRGLFPAANGESAPVIFADGSCHSISENVGDEFWRGAFTRNGGEVLVDF